MVGTAESVFIREVSFIEGFCCSWTRVLLIRCTFQSQHLLKEEVSQVRHPLLLLLPGTGLEEVFHLLSVSELKLHGLFTDLLTH